MLSVFFAASALACTPGEVAKGAMYYTVIRDSAQKTEVVGTATLLVGTSVSDGLPRRELDGLASSDGRNYGLSLRFNRDQPKRLSGSFFLSKLEGQREPTVGLDSVRSSAMVPALLVFPHGTAEFRPFGEDSLEVIVDGYYSGISTTVPPNGMHVKARLVVGCIKTFRWQCPF